MSIRLVACLGNPGPKYRLTWHNAGFWTADVLAAEAGVRFRNSGLFEAAELPAGATLIKPSTFMNESGGAVASLMRSKGLGPDEILVVCDDVNLRLGRLRLRSSGSSGGHKGLRSIIASIGTQAFPRLRLGVGPAPERGDLADFVLSRVPRDEEEKASTMAHRAADCVSEVLSRGMEAAQETWNRAPGEPPPAD